MSHLKNHNFFTPWKHFTVLIHEGSLSLTESDQANNFIFFQKGKHLWNGHFLEYLYKPLKAAMLPIYILVISVWIYLLYLLYISIAETKYIWRSGLSSGAGRKWHEIYIPSNSRSRAFACKVTNKPSIECPCMKRRKYFWKQI